jgi:hypothetical protein
MLVGLGKQPGHAEHQKAAAATAAEKRCHGTLRNVYDARRLQPNVHRKRRRDAANG